MPCPHAASPPTTTPLHSLFNSHLYLLPLHPHQISKQVNWVIDMERPCTNGVIRLPPGFRFHPTDEELVSLYLKRKALSCPVPAAIIPEIDFLRHNPADLPGLTYSGGSEGEMYLFSQREAKYHKGKGSRSKRATRCGSGYWKASGKDKAVLGSIRGRGSSHSQVIGFKKTLVFYQYQGKPPRGTRTHWIMHEYRLQHDSAIMSTNWVLCRIFKKKRNNQADMELMDHADAVEETLPGSPPPLSDSSCVTDTCDENANADHEGGSRKKYGGMLGQRHKEGSPPLFLFI